MRKRSFRLAICTGGGDCPGLNSAIRAATRHAIFTHGWEVLGIRDGLTGILSTPYDTRELSLADVDAIHDWGGTILGTNNKGSPLRDPDVAAQSLAAIKKAWRTLRIDALAIIGGDGTHWMAKQLHAAGYPIVGIPKTIDNDLVGSEQTIGFATAVDIAAEAAQRLRSSALAHNRIMVLEVMGRDAGHIALHAGLASGADAVLIPELPFSWERLRDAALRPQPHRRQAWLVIAAEGAHPTGGTPSLQESATGTRILGGIGQQVARELHLLTGTDARSTVLGHLQRGGPANAADRVFAACLATHAIDLAAKGRFGRIAALRHGQIADFSYTAVTQKRRLVNLDGAEFRCALANNVTFGHSD